MIASHDVCQFVNENRAAFLAPQVGQQGGRKQDLRPESDRPDDRRNGAVDDSYRRRSVHSQLAGQIVRVALNFVTRVFRRGDQPGETADSNDCHGRDQQ